MQLKSPVLVLFILTLAPAVQVQAQVPVDVSITVKDAEIVQTGRFVLGFDFLPEEDIDRAYSIRVAIYAGSRRVMTRHHHPEPPTKTWKAGKTVRYEIPCVYPWESPTGDDQTLRIHLGFHDSGERDTLPPFDGVDIIDGMALIDEMKRPVFESSSDEARVKDLVTRAREMARTRPPVAWSMLDLGIRMSDTDPDKAVLRGALVSLGDFKPRPLSMEEQQIVARRIASERRRYLRLISGRMFDRGQYHGALRILKDIGGALSQEADAAVIGALADAKRIEKDVQDIKQRLLSQLSEEDKQDTTRDMEKLQPDRKMFERAEQYTKKKRWGAARRLLRELRFAEDSALRDAAYRRLKELEKSWLDAIPTEEVTGVDEAVNHPAWARTVAVPTHNFVLIGPRTLVENIDPKSRQRFDIAYIFLTDLFGRLPNPAGDRVTVYFKELWEFGGGVGGGKTIDIGRAKPDRRRYPLDTGLMFHELTHCVDDTVPIHSGFREGLADFGATYAYEALGDRSTASNRIRSHLAAFKEDYLVRDLEYWRIPNYAPSAGFFEHFVQKYAKESWGHDWSGFRKFFRAYRNWHMRDGREPYIVRALGHFLMESFGPGAFDDLVSFRFPLLASDKEAIPLEIEKFPGRETELLEDEGDEFGNYPNSPLPRDLSHKELMSQAKWEDECVRTSKNIGILRDWHVIGPFKTDKGDPDAVIFPPEYEIDFSKEYESPAHVLKWRVPGKDPVSMAPFGWVGFHFNYQSNSAFYGITHITVDREIPAYAWFRCDDDGSVWINDELLGKYRTRGRSSSAWIWWRGPSAKVPDAMRFPVVLRPGRNKVLLKVKNRSGGSGFTFALTRRDGTPIQGMKADDRLPDPAQPASKSPAFRRTMRHNFENKSYRSKLDVTAGKFAVRSKHLAGQSTNRGVAWRKYTVRPGFPKDSPSNMFWLKPKFTKDIGDFEFDMELATEEGRAPKIAVTFQGIKGRDGLSGWTLILHPSGRNQVSGRLERYDRLVYQAPSRPLGDGTTRKLSISHVGHRIRVSLGGKTIFDDVSLRPIPDREAIGVMTWGPRTRIKSLELRKARTR